MERWQFMSAWHQNMMRNFYKRPTQSQTEIMDRVVFFVEYLKEYEKWDAVRQSQGLPATPLWKYLNRYRFNYTKVETYFILRRRNIEFRQEGQLLADMLESSKLDGIAQVFTIKFKYRPTSDLEWMNKFSHHYHAHQDVNTGPVAQRNFLTRVHELLHAIDMSAKTEGNNYGTDVEMEPQTSQDMVSIQ